MLLLKMMTSPSVRAYPHKSKLFIDPLSTSTFYKQIPRRPNEELFRYDDAHQISLKRLFHTTRTNRDIEAAFRAIGGGIAATGVIGPGIGMGIIFGNLLSATARNPSIANKVFQYGIMGAAFCESLAFFALMIAFIALP